MESSPERRKSGKKKKSKEKPDRRKGSPSKRSSSRSRSKRESAQLEDPKPEVTAIPQPLEVITGNLLTHYDETAGVALPRSAVESHRGMGNTVIPLIESFKTRYDRLRSMITGRLMPRREHLLQLRRQLQNCSLEVEAACKSIERETMEDVQQILDRLHTAESLRQSNIRHQVYI